KIQRKRQICEFLLIECFQSEYDVGSRRGLFHHTFATSLIACIGVNFGNLQFSALKCVVQIVHVRLQKCYRLYGHVISEHNTLNFLKCSLYCLRKPSHCKSINYKARKHKHPSNNCQLNNATKTAHPQNLLPNKNYDYYEPLTVQKEIQKQEPVNYGMITSNTFIRSRLGEQNVVMTCTNQASQPPGFTQSTQMAMELFVVVVIWKPYTITIFQRRVDGSEDFYRNWTDYKTGFGNLSGEFWLGLDKIHRLSASGQNILRVDLESFENERAYAVYESFSMGNESEVYILNVGNYSG
ncbi:Hypothetical predicted protein, partial [Paramuricea clavata]